MGAQPSRAGMESLIVVDTEFGMSLMRGLS